MGEEPAHPGIPSRTAYLLAFASVVVAGLLGGTIGYGLVDVSCEGNCGLAIVTGALISAAAAAAGVGVIAVLVLRAMAEWKRNQPG
jgi:hypothetical protein